MKKEESVNVVTVKIQDTQVPQTIKNDFLAKSYDIESNDAIDLIKLVVYSIAEFLGEVKDKSTKKIGLRIVDNSGNGQFIIGIIVEYIPGDTEEDPGSWSLYSTFSEDDIKSCGKIYESTDQAFLVHMDTVAVTNFNMQFKGPEIKIITIQLVWNAFIKYAKSNAKENEVTAIEVPEYMLFKYSLNKELLDMAVDFDHSIKMLIKDDAVLAKA